MEKEDSWTLDTNLKDVEKLFAFNSINFKTSFCKNLLTAINLPTYFKSVQSFSKCIKVKKSWSVVPEDENPAVYVFAVDVVCKNGGIAIVERVCALFLQFLVIYNQCLYQCKYYNLIF